MQNLNIYLIDFLIRSYIYKKTVYKATSIFSRAIKLLLWRSRSAVFVIFGGFSGGPLAGVAHLLVEHVKRGSGVQNPDVPRTKECQKPRSGKERHENDVFGELYMS
jgi:hypothetical protein